MITMREDVSAIVSATRSHADRTIIELPFVRVAVRLSYSEADKGMSTEIRILYMAGQVKRFPVTTRAIKTATARAIRRTDPNDSACRLGLNLADREGWPPTANTNQHKLP